MSLLANPSLTRRAALGGLVASLWLARSTRAQERTLGMLAAANLKPALEPILDLWRRNGGSRVAVTYGASASLLRQLEHGVPTDVFLPADSAWIEFARDRGLVRAETRRDLAGDRLALIAPRDSSLIEVTLAASTRLSVLAGEDGRIAIGDPSMVTAGRLARSALSTLGMLADAGPRLIEIESEARLLALVARDELSLGIVPASEARLEPAVKIVALFPPESHAPILLAAALTSAAGSDAAALLAHLAGDAAGDLFAKAGFAPPR